MTYQTYKFPIVLEQTGVGQGFGLVGRDEIYPLSCGAAIYETDQGRMAGVFQFGRRVSWSSKPLANVKAETIDQKPTFRERFKTSRCLIPADGWTEYIEVPGAPRSAAECKRLGLTKNGKQKKRYFVASDSEPKGQLFYLAGLYGNAAAVVEGKKLIVPCMLIITTGANTQIAASGHHRQPVIMSPQHYDDWLAVGNDDTGALQEMLVSRDYEGLVIG